MNVILSKLSQEFFYYDRSRAYETVKGEPSLEEKKNQ